jgi:glycosyltransferase involved in cell wall biosynthesis
MNILFYTVANKRSRDIESQAIEFASQGNTIFLLTQSPRSELHDIFESKGFHAAFSQPSKGIFPVYLIREVIRLVFFCYRYKITIIHSHLDPCNLVAVCSQVLVRSHVIVNRHHADALLYEASKRSQRISRWIYRAARHIIVVSTNTKRYMVDNEGIAGEKITVIPLSFNFELYEQPTSEEVMQIRQKYDASILLCTVGRFTTLKRIDDVIRLVHLLNKKGVSTKLLILGSGPGEGDLKKLARELAVLDEVIFIGFTNRVLPYIAAADYYVHFSITEASCTTVKEAGLASTPVIVCTNVGDFNEYISPTSGFFVEKDNLLHEACERILNTYANKTLLKEMGTNLRNTVRSHFDIKRVMPLYAALHQMILKN